MAEAERIINDLNVVKITLCNPQMLLTPEMCVKIGRVINSAIALLKEQEPRVMTLEDVKQAEVGTVVWLEWRIESKINSGIFFRLINKGIDDSLEFHVLDGFVAARLACYGTEWRCWTSRPTDEQRKAVKWDEAD